MVILRKAINKVIGIQKKLRNVILSLRYGFSPTKHVAFGKRVRLVNPQYIDVGGKSSSTMMWNCV